MWTARQEISKLKTIIEEQHKDLTDIKKKIKSFTDLLNK
jgi:cell division protein FtsL